MKTRETSNRDLDLDFDSKVQEYALERSLNRLYFITLVMSGLFAVYGFVSIDFVRNFRPDVGLLDNVWPRILFNSIPLLFLALYLRRGQAKRATKVLIWIVCFSVVFDAACMVHVWPIAWSGDPQIMLYVHSTNCSVFMSIGMLLALPLKKAIYSLFIIGAIFWAPLFWVVQHGGDPVVFKTVVNDTVFLSLSGFLFGVGFHKGEVRLARLEIRRETEAKKFLGPVVSRAIFEDKAVILSSRRVKGFMIAMDIRDSTEYLQEFGTPWLAFRREYFSMVSRIVKKYGGMVHKTMGDGHILSFGIIEYDADLSDIPGIETEEKRAEERRLKHFSGQAFSCLEEIFHEFMGLAEKHFPGRNIRLGAGMDKGDVDVGVHGDDSASLELDVNGDPVNCSNRLQDYSKAIQGLFAPDSSLLIVSPFAADFLEDFSDFRKVETQKIRIRNYTKIAWVLVKEYSRKKASLRMVS